MPIRNPFRALLDAIRSGGWFGPYGSGDKILLELLGGGQPTTAGLTVTEYTALNISAVWAAVNVLAGPVSTLPLVLYRRKGERGKEPFVTHRVYKLLHDDPNPETTSVMFRETLMQHVLLWGNGYAEIQRDSAGVPWALWNLLPDRVEPYRDPGSRLITYRVRQDDGSTVTVDADRILHVPGLSWDGVLGYSVIRKARESLGLLAATERFGASFFGNGAWPGIVAQHPGKLSEEAHKRLKASLNDALQGPNRAHSLIVTEEGIKIEKAGIPPNDAQFLETRKFQTLEVARWFGIPPHMIGDLERATFANIEQQSIDFVSRSLMPWLVKIEKELERKLIRPLERGQQFIKFNVKGLLRGDTLTRYQAHAIAVQWGWASPNDVREIEDENPIGAAGDKYLLPLNMVPSDTIPSTKDRVDAVGALIRAGYDPAESLEAVGLPAIKHGGAPPVTVQPLDNYPGAADKAGAFGQPDPPQKGDDEQGAPPERMLQLVEGLREGLDRTRQAAEAADAAVRALPPPPPPPSDAHLIERIEGLRERLDHVTQADQAALHALAGQMDAARGADRDLLAAALAEARAAAEADHAAALATISALQGELTARLDVDKAERQAQAARIASLVPSLRDVIEEALRKEVRFEAARARKAARNPEAFRGWLDSFYATREDAMVQFLLPSMRLHFTLAGRPEDAEAETRILIRTHLTESRAALVPLLDTPDTLEADVTALVTRWETERPARIADALLREVIANV